MTKEQALNAFWNGFGIPAYDVNTVPDTATMPYITFDVYTGSLDEEIPLTASLWYYDTTWSDIGLKTEEIGEFIGLGGHSQKYDNGRIWIKRGFPFSSRMNEPGNKFVRRMVINILAEFQSEN